MNQFRAPTSDALWMHSPFTIRKVFVYVVRVLKATQWQVYKFNVLLWQFRCYVVPFYIFHCRASRNILICNVHCIIFIYTLYYTIHGQVHKCAGMKCVMQSSCFPRKCQRWNFLLLIRNEKQVSNTLFDTKNWRFYTFLSDKMSFSTSDMFFFSSYI